MQPSTSATEPEALTRLRQTLLEQHDVRIPKDDPLCLEFTMFSEVVETMLASLRTERRANTDDLRDTLQHATYAIRTTLEDASRPLAKSMADVFDPRAVAERISTEVYDDLQRAGQQMFRQARAAFIAIAATVLCAAFAVLYLASQQLAEARALRSAPYPSALYLDPGAPSYAPQ